MYVYDMTTCTPCWNECHFMTSLWQSGACGSFLFRHLIPPPCLYEAKEGHIYADLSGKVLRCVQVSIVSVRAAQLNAPHGCSQAATSGFLSMKTKLTCTVTINAVYGFPNLRGTTLNCVLSPQLRSKQTELGVFVFVIKVIAQVLALSRCNHRTSIR